LGFNCCRASSYKLKKTPYRLFGACLLGVWKKKKEGELAPVALKIERVNIKNNTGSLKCYRIKNKNKEERRIEKLQKK
jgi:hypothetical protein